MPKILRSSDRKIADFQTAVTFEPLEQFCSEKQTLQSCITS